MPRGFCCVAENIMYEKYHLLKMHLNCVMIGLRGGNHFENGQEDEGGSENDGKSCYGDDRTV